MDQPAGGYPAAIARPSSNYSTTNRVEVLVGGRVQLPGLVRLPVGGTVLQAISLAGGFGEMAFTKRIEITKRDKTILVFLHFRRSPVSGHRIAWYGSKDWNGDETVMDYVLDDGDKVNVPTTQ